MSNVGTIGKCACAFSPLVYVQAMVSENKEEKATPSFQVTSAAVYSGSVWKACQISAVSGAAGDRLSQEAHRLK